MFALIRNKYLCLYWLPSLLVNYFDLTNPYWTLNLKQQRCFISPLLLFDNLDSLAGTVNLNAFQGNAVEATIEDVTFQAWYGGEFGYVSHVWLLEGLRFFLLCLHMERKPLYHVVVLKISEWETYNWGMPLFNLRNDTLALLNSVPYNGAIQVLDSEYVITTKKWGLTGLS